MMNKAGMSGFVMAGIVSGSRALGITSDEVEQYKNDHHCNTESALMALIAER